MDIRRLDETDWQAYRAVRLAALRDEPTSFGSDAEFEAGLGEAWFRQALRGSFIFAAWRDGAIVGLAAWRANAVAKQAHIGAVWGMYVAPTERGLGTGRALLEALIAHARGQGVEGLKLFVTVGNGAAQRLYDRLGFVPYGLEPKTLKLGGRYYDNELRMLWLRS